MPAPPYQLPTPNTWQETAMVIALEEALQAWNEDEVPVGAVIMHHDQLIAKAHNRREKDQDPTGHAELIAIRQAAEKLGSWRLENCTLFVTLEPCCMCAGAIVQARIPWLYYGADDPKAGAVESLYQLLVDPRLNHQTELLGKLYTDISADMLRAFFRTKRCHPS